MTTIGIVAVGIALLLIGLLVYAATRPKVFRVRRSVDIKAAAQDLYAQISDLHAWNAWSPYEKRDPAMKRTFGAITKGVGAVYEWDGNSKVGAGRMEVLQALPPSKILIRLDFLRPFEGHNTAEFSLDAKDDATTVTWAMYGPNAFMARLMGIFFSMDKMIGRDFESGLANLKGLAEKK